VKSLDRLVTAEGFQVEGLWFMGQDIFTTVVQMALLTPGFLDTPYCQLLLDHDDEFQDVVDRGQLLDEVVLVACKPE